MKIEHWSLRLRVFLFFAFLSVAGIGAVIAGLYFGYHRLGLPAALDGFVFAGAVSSFAILGVTVWIWLMFDENVAKPIQRLSGGLLARAHADVDDELDEATAKYLGDLAPAARAVTQNLSSTRNQLADSVAQETTRLVEEKAKLSALAAEMPLGVALLSGNHKLAFYNGAAAELLDTDHAAGLDHSIFDYLREAPIRSAYRRLCAGEGGDGHVIPLTVATTHGGHTLAARLRLMHSPTESEATPPYVLTLEDVTDDLAVHVAREALLRRLFNRLRPSVATLKTTLDARASDDALRQDARLDAAMLSEMATLITEFREMDAAYEAAKSDWWRMGTVRGAELCDALTARLEEDGIALSADVPEPINLTLDAVQIISLIDQVAHNLTRDGAKALSLLITPEETGAMIALGWSGEPLSVDRLDGWMRREIDVGLANMTGRVILDMHGTEIWPEEGRGSRAVLKLPIREAHRPRRQASDARRSVAYDFDLLAKTPPKELIVAPLSNLTYVVFDTETTGLLPSQGDEICQIAALRVINSKVVQGEHLDCLVHPNRDIPATSTAVHHITNEMVRDAPPIDVVGRQLHSFARGAVLVAHNAPFDLEFLRRHESDIGASFTNPVLDTVLLSAVVFGQSQEHTLDAICDRLGVTIPAEARHTAMGDTVATAEVFIKMMRMAQERGITTFGEMLSEMRKHKRLLQDANTHI
ncbi:exonuclease domain-containing protein [Celeribacter sp.]|uniref:3'-5' exonuclease n=1 Tax=Celeribacter sp. TaxID=1890673 RepID=UPI003A8EDADC